MSALRRYLGDSVYAGVDRGMVILTTDNSMPNDPSNTIYLEPDVLEKLARFVADMREIQEL